MCLIQDYPHHHLLSHSRWRKKRVEREVERKYRLENSSESILVVGATQSLLIVFFIFFRSTVFQHYE